MECVRNMLNVSELNNSTKEWAYHEILCGKNEVLRGGRVEKFQSN